MVFVLYMLGHAKASYGFHTLSQKT